MPKLSGDEGETPQPQSFPNQPALHYLPTPCTYIDIAIKIGGDVGLMIRAFAATLEDDNLLVRRASLDLLLQSLCLDGPVMHKAQLDDRIILMSSATGVVLRRDSALNRRLYTWLLGTDENGDAQVAYLKKYALDLLCTTLKVCHTYPFKGVDGEADVR